MNVLRVCWLVVEKEPAQYLGSFMLIVVSCPVLTCSSEPWWEKASACTRWCDWATPSCRTSSQWSVACTSWASFAWSCKWFCPGNLCAGLSSMVRVCFSFSVLLFLWQWYTHYLGDKLHIIAVAEFLRKSVLGNLSDFCCFWPKKVCCSNWYYPFVHRVPRKWEISTR